MAQTVISLTKKLISIKSTPDNATALRNVLDLALAQLKGYTIERFERNGIRSALVYNTKRRPKKFKVLLNGHLDIIPGKELQYVPKIKGKRLYGVGSMDMKASVACLIATFNEVADRVAYPLGLQLVTDEEVGGFDGTKLQIEKGVRADFVIVGESTNLNIENRAKGVLWAKISTQGKAAHGAYPWKGENAVWKMQNFLSRLQKRFPVPKKEKWITTVNLSSIETANKTFNKIPDSCEIWLDIRYIPSETNTIVKDLRKMLPKGFKLDIVAKEPAVSTDERNQYLQLLRKEIGRATGRKTRVLSANGSSDARHFTRIRCPSVEFGPIGGGMGSDNEWVDIESLKTNRQILLDFLQALDKDP